MTLDLAAQLLLATAMLLALGFHRHRAAQLAALLWLLLLGAQGDTLRVQEGALRFAPWLMLVCAAMPESRLLSRRHGLLLLASATLVAITLTGPPHIFAGLRNVAAWPLPLEDARQAAALLCACAAFACLAWWSFSARVIELGLAVVMLLAAAGCASYGAMSGWFAAAGATAVLAILYAGYRMAYVDTLTGLPNRRALDEALSRLPGNYALAMIDIDHFKGFNDTYGHAAGDIVLREVGQMLRRHAGGRTYRYGGEEFCVVFEGRESEKPLPTLERARKAIGIQRVDVPAPAPKRARRSRSAAETRQVSVTISAGCAQRGPQRRSWEEVMKAADAALYKAKQKGRNRVVAA